MPTSALRGALQGVALARYPKLRTAFASWPSQVQASGASVPTITPGASHAEGSWTELDSAVDGDIDLLVCALTGGDANASDNSKLLDIGTGASLSEVEIVSNVAIGGTYPNGYRYLHLPVRVSAGTRLAARIQAARSAPSAVTFRWWAYKWPATLRSPSSLVTMGANTGSSKGTTISSDDTYVEIEDSTTQAFQALVVGYGVNGDTAMTNLGQEHCTVGIGPAGSEVAVGTFAMTSIAGSDTFLHVSGGLIGCLFPYHVPAGSRIAVKAATGSTNNEVDVTVTGVPYA